MRMRNIIGVFLLVVIGYTAMIAQNPYADLEQELEQYQHDQRPRKVAEVLRKIGEKAERQHDFPMLLHSILRFVNPDNDIQDYPEEQLFDSLEALAQKDWLKPTDRAMILFLKLRLYLQYVDAYSVVEKASDTIPHNRLRLWPKQALRKAFEQDLSSFLGYRGELIHTQTSSYQPVFESNSSDCQPQPMSLYLTCLSVLTTDACSVDARRMSPILIEELHTASGFLENRREQLAAASLLLFYERQAQLLSDSAYTHCLDTLIFEYSDLPDVLGLVADRAKAYQHDQAYVEALQLCETYISKYPQAPLIGRLKNIRTEVLFPSVKVSFSALARTQLHHQLTIFARNVGEVHVSLYPLPITPLEVSRKREEGWEQYAHDAIWDETIALSQCDDLKEDSTTCLLPDLPRGIYLIRAQAAKCAFDGIKPEIEYHPFFVSDLYLLHKQGIGGIQVLDAYTGKPKEGVSVQGFLGYANSSFNDYPHEVEDRLPLTDRYGRTDFPDSLRSVYIYTEDDQAHPRISVTGYSNTSFDPQHIEEREYIISTDRAVYRPGQKVHFFGQCDRIGYAVEQAHVVPNKEVWVSFYDADNEEITRARCQSDDMGRFSGSFDIPQGKLNGTFRLYLKGGSFYTIQVEEYKRPTFEVNLDTPSEAYSLGDSLSVSGFAKTFSGLDLANATVSYRLTVQVYQRWWGMPTVDVVDDAKTVTDGSGRFTIPICLSDPTSADTDTFFRYTLAVHVTSSEGETQSQELIIPVGHEPKRIDLLVEGRQTEEQENWLVSDLPSLSFQLTNTLAESVEGKISYYLSQKSEQLIAGMYTTASNQQVEAPSDWAALPSGTYQLYYGEAGTDKSAWKHINIYLFHSGDRRLVDPASPLWVYVGEDEYDRQQDVRVLVGCAPEGKQPKKLYLFYDLTYSGHIVERRMITCKPGEILEIKPALPEGLLPEEMRISLYYVYQGQAYTHFVDIRRKLSNREIRMQWSSFRDKLSPGQKETWSLQLFDASGQPLTHAMLSAWMYDAALNNISYPSKFLYSFLSLKPNQWVTNLYPTNFYRVIDSDRVMTSSDFYLRFSSWTVFNTQPCLWQPSPYPYISLSRPFYGYATKRSLASPRLSVAESTDILSSMSDLNLVEESLELKSMEEKGLSQEVSIRKNFAETAFFQPALRTNQRGEVSWSFVLPESLTRWNLFLFAHTSDMRMAIKQEMVEVKKDFMLTVNMPRFLRMDDEGTVLTTVRNESDKEQKGVVSIELFDPATDETLLMDEQPFSVGAGESMTVTFPLKPIGGYEAIGVRLFAKSDEFSDGEQHLLPQLPATERVVETIPLVLHGGQPQTIALDGLFPHKGTRPINGSMALQVVSNPLWIAVQALPIMAKIHQNDVVSVASALYANSIASALVGGQLSGVPNLGESLIRYLQQPLDSVPSEPFAWDTGELPWRAEMLSEHHVRQNLQALVDRDSLTLVESELVDKLGKLQKSDGWWSWYPEMSDNSYLTDYVMTILVRLSALGAMPDNKLLQEIKDKGWNALDASAILLQVEMQKVEKNGGPKHVVLPERALNYLYLLTLEHHKPQAKAFDAYRYFLDILVHSLSYIDLRDMPRAAIILSASGYKDLSDKFLQSIREHIIHTPEQGDHFALATGGYYWCDSRYGMQTDAIEAFVRMGYPQDLALIEGLQTWLLNQKRTQIWPTRPASSDAVYALLLGAGANKIEEAIVQAETPLADEPKTFSGVSGSQVIRLEDLPSDAEMTARLSRSGEGFAWVSFFAEYDVPTTDMVATGNGLMVTKQLYTEQVIDGEIMLVPVEENAYLELGTTLVVQITITLDRDMDFVALSDNRSAALEPTEQISGYNYTAGTFYYSEVKDSQTRFYFDRLVRGVYQLRYSTKVVRPGLYSTGVASVSSAYAPEFSGHTDGGQQLKISRKKQL